VHVKKINHESGFKSCVYSWCTGLHGSEYLLHTIPGRGVYMYNLVP
jgi:hypothetical protein